MEIIVVLSTFKSNCESYNMSTSHPELLDHLANLVNCEYISDLRYRVSAAAMGCALRSIPAEAFPSEQWCETASYLMGKNCVPEDRADCRQQLLAYYLARRQKK